MSISQLITPPPACRPAGQSYHRPDPPAAGQLPRSASRRQLVKIQPPAHQPPAAGQCSSSSSTGSRSASRWARFTVQDPAPCWSRSSALLVKIQPPAGPDPATSWTRSAASWSRSAAQIRQPLAQIRDQLAAFFVLGPQHIGSFYAGPDRENLKKSPRPAVVQTLARAMFRTNIYVKNRTMFHVKQCTINRQTTEFLLTAQKPCILCT